MGDFIIEVKATGGHGCQRNIKDGQQVQNFCGSIGCPDCAAREFVRVFKRMGVYLRSATITHWPDTAGTVIDDMLTGVRTGSF